MRSLIAIAALLASSILSAEQGNYILGPIDDAPIEIAVPEIAPLREFNWIDLRLGLTMDEVERILKKRGWATNKSGWGFSRIAWECKQLVNAKSCTLNLWSDPGRTWAKKAKPAYLTILVYEEKVIGIKFVEHSYRAELWAEYANGVSDSRPPTSVDEGEVVWQEDGVILSVRWSETPRMLLLDTVKFDESKQAP